jgi:hypothetical protein
VDPLIKQLNRDEEQESEQIKHVVNEINVKKKRVPRLKSSLSQGFKSVFSFISKQAQTVRE